MNPSERRTQRPKWLKIDIPEVHAGLLEGLSTTTSVPQFPGLSIVPRDGLCQCPCLVQVADKQADLYPVINDSQAERVKILMDFKRRKIDNVQIAIPEGSSRPRSCCIADARLFDPPKSPLQPDHLDSGIPSCLWYPPRPSNGPELAGSVHYCQ